MKTKKLLSQIGVLGIFFFASFVEAKTDPLFSSYRESTPAFHSQASQDEFVYSILYTLLDKQDPGYYVEIGAGEPIDINNTYFFETALGWKGISIDISKDLSGRWYPVRKNLLLSEDATLSNYPMLLQNAPQVIDYLSLDVDGYYDTVLEKLSSAKRIFKVITIEHDFYRYGDQYRKKEREILTSQGYHLLCPDVCHTGKAFEDWWIHPSFFPPTVFSKLSSLNVAGKEHTEIIKILKALIAEIQNKAS